MNNTLTPHFTLLESLHTNTRLPNNPTPPQQQRILNTAYNMEIVRAVLGRKPIIISSWFRSQEVNERVGGVPDSEHTLGAAVDFTCPAFGSPYEICRTLVSAAHILNYNQLIYEGGWVHISFPPDGTPGKNEVLTRKGKNYLKGLVV